MQTHHLQLLVSMLAKAQQRGITATKTILQHFLDGVAGVNGSSHVVVIDCVPNRFQPHEMRSDI